ncbi:MAG TPA: cation transporter [Leptospiraceae bacterium]|nr:cation transporter [Leptospiraceae bacterium]HMW04962.1 cation transporter [Leptospiraceae bacterium]HMX31889.1 cation transporter [Leptospiraceae bacterium]HMY30817.1 cation transporter [Leptospiraceae bacterium]HMZ64278.1 cation transporter [Leptospiraceae bacterium]
MTSTYQIEGMTCGHCVKQVEKEFSKAGINAKADLKSNSVSIDSELDSNAYSQIKTALEEEGYSLGNKI